MAGKKGGNTTSNQGSRPSKSSSVIKVPYTNDKTPTGNPGTRASNTSSQTTKK